jgi:hypothetical protein
VSATINEWRAWNGVGLGKKFKGGRVFVLMPLLPEAINISMQGNYNIYYTILEAIVNPGINYFLSLQTLVYRYICIWMVSKGEKKE